MGLPLFSSVSDSAQFLPITTLAQFGAPTDRAEIFERLGVSVLLGLLVGLQRQHADPSIAGLRTFALITVLGTICGIQSTTLGPWLAAAGFVGVITLIVVANALRLRVNANDAGITTESAILVMYAVGVLLGVAPPENEIVAVACGGGVAVLLQFKPQLHSFVRQLSDTDLVAIMKFVLIAFIIYPLLPDAAYGPFEVLNPRAIWLMVVLIVGISLGGYIVSRFVGREAGIVAGGVLGGIISSTATTVSYSRRAGKQPASAALAATIITVASVIVFVRVLTEIYVVAPQFLPSAAPPILTLMLVLSGLAFLLWSRTRRELGEPLVVEAPVELRSAIFFGVLYAVVLVGVSAGKAFLSDQWLFLVAAVSGLTDMDAITLSVARLVDVGRLEHRVGWQLIVTGSLANLLFKTGVIAALAGQELLRPIALTFGLTIVGGVGILALWP
jgi:uncharacterized membrane protein (DUF4010 family)